MNGISNCTELNVPTGPASIHDWLPNDTSTATSNDSLSHALQIDTAGVFGESGSSQGILFTGGSITPKSRRQQTQSIQTGKVSNRTVCLSQVV